MVSSISVVVHAVGENPIFANTLNDTFGDPHGIDLTTYDVLVRYNTYNKVDYSDNDGASWTTGVTPQALVDAHSIGTVFKLVGDSGTRFYGWHCKPKQNQHFKADGTVRLVGGRNLGTVGWTASGGAWYKDVSFSAANDYRNVNNMDDPTDPDGLPDRVWIDDETWRTHVSTTPGSGQFRIQYNTPSVGTHRVWIGDDPSQATTIELASYGPSSQWWAFGAADSTGILASGVVIENLHIEKYAPPLFRTAIGGATTNFPNGWKLRYCTVSRISSTGVQVSSGFEMEHCEIAWCGQMGRRGGCSDGQPDGSHSIVDLHDNRIHHNAMISSLNADYDGGAQKLSHGKAGYHVHNEWIHDNRSMGLWWDFDSENYGGMLCYSNLVENNWGHGIFDEISDCPVGEIRDIYWNIVRGNGSNVSNPNSDAGTGITISNSRRTRVRENAVTGTRTCLAIFADNRTPGAIDNVVVDNQVKGGADRSIFKIRRNNGDTKPSGETIDRNEYWPDAGTNWRSDPNSYDFAGWQGLGYDTNGNASLATDPALSAGATAFAEKHYGSVVL